MKLMYCIACGHMVKLAVMKWTYCKCKTNKSCARYLEDRAHSEFYGPNAVPIGLSNPSLMEAIGERYHGDKNDEQKLKIDTWVFGPATSQRVRILKKEEFVTEEEMDALRAKFVAALGNSHFAHFLKNNFKAVSLPDLEETLKKLCDEMSFGPEKHETARHEFFYIPQPLPEVS